MKRLKTKQALSIIAVGIALVAVAGLLNYFSHPPAPMVLKVSTLPLPTLLPHYHGAGDKVSDDFHGVDVNSYATVVPEDMWVTEIRVFSTNAPKSIIHHMHLLRLGTTEFPEDTSLTQLLATVGQENDGVFLFPEPSGIFIPKGTQLVLDTMLHNPIPPKGEGGIYKDVMVGMELTGVRTGEGRNRSIEYTLLRLTDGTDFIKDGTFTVPPNVLHYTQTSAESPEDTKSLAELTFPDSGWIVYLGGHFHPWEGGEKVEVLLNGETIKTFESELQDPNIPWSWVTPVGPSFIRVQKGDELTLTATYSNPGDEPIVGAMGISGVFYILDSDTTTDPTHLLTWTVRGFLYPLLEQLGIHHEE